MQCFRDDPPEKKGQFGSFLLQGSMQAYNFKSHPRARNCDWHMASNASNISSFITKFWFSFHHGHHMYLSLSWWSITIILWRLMPFWKTIMKERSWLLKFQNKKSRSILLLCCMNSLAMKNFQMADHVWNRMTIIHCKPLIMHAFVLFSWHAQVLHTMPSF